MPTESSSRQTLTFLLRRLQQAGIRPSARRGQNFLVDLNLHRLLVDSADVGPNDVVLEVGPGAGALTGLLSERAAAVVSIEVDPRLHQLASEELYGRDNVTLLLGDALSGKHSLAPPMLDAIAARLAEGPDRRFKLVANLPYCVATPVIANLLALDRPPVSLTMTIQKELAERIVSPAGSKDYGSLSIWVGCQCQASVVRELPPSVFWPQPKVRSAIVHLALDEDRRQRISDRAAFHAFVRALFLHRRKRLRVVLPGVCGEATSKEHVDSLLAELGLRPDCRAEQLDVDQMLRLFDAARERGMLAAK